VVTILDARPVHLRRCDRKLHLDLAAIERAADLEAGVTKDAEHGAVLRQHLRYEPLDAGCCRALGKPLEQPRPDATPLQLVGDHERDLGCARITQPRVARKRDDPALIGRGKRTSRLPFRIEEHRDELPVDIAGAVEAQIAAMRRKPLEERNQRVRVCGRRRMQP
jgi:hypothetical protein